MSALIAKRPTGWPPVRRTATNDHAADLNRAHVSAFISNGHPARIGFGGKSGH
jgi:hypothetical protein